MPDSFLSRLAHAPLLGDGATGTLLYSHGIAFEQCFDALNLEQPALVQELHAEYLRAGAEIIETNTFGANRFKLQEHGLEHRVAEINAAGVRLARDAVNASGKNALVAASVGPLGVQLAPVGSISRQEAHDAFREQIAALVSEKPDALIFETFGNLPEITEAIRAAQQVEADAVSPIPLIAQMTFTNDGVTQYGYTPVQVAHALVALKVNVIGVNCSVGPARMLPVIEQIIHTVHDDPRRPGMIYFSAQPNAGFPQANGGRIFYPATPDYFGAYARRFAEAGVNLIGGCCGTTPQHIRAMRLALDAYARTARKRTRITSIAAHAPESKPLAPEPPTQLQQKLDAGHFVVGVEMAPPRGFNPDKVLAGALILKQAGADVINVADSPRAQMRMSAWAVAHLIQTEIGVESVLHFPVRGRNLLRVHGDLMAAHALRVRNIFACMGDPAATGDYPQATDAYDIVPSGLVKLVKQHFNAGIDHAGTSIGAPCSFTAGVACDFGARDVAREIKTLRKKIEAGADFCLTQPIYEPRSAREFLKRYADEYGKLELPILAGVLPLASSRHAEFLHNEVPGITLTDEIRERMRRAGDNGRAEGLNIAQELWNELLDFAQGVYIMPAFGRYDTVAELLDAVRVRA
ncbi:bifunctional homocysteine S-methyltransferase/methylenetetrahydrofolate reductase [Anaerolineae bacterium CFX7]|nr:bifunctional homocysteine S-methyltransferase/methylenetetrahydrofolate reductase [Anaerolineae bacterium CFX7]